MCYKFSGNLKKLFSKLKLAETQQEKDNILSELQPVITYANIAVDECDFGTGLEVGIDLFCSGIKELQSSALNSLQAAYRLLKRDVFLKILQVRNFMIYILFFIHYLYLFELVFS